MELLTKELEERFAKIGEQDNGRDPLVIVKFFNPVGRGTWFATEYNPETKIFFGYVSIFGDQNDEWGTFSLEELKAISGFGGLGIERDLHFKEQPIKPLIKHYTKRR